MPFCALRSVLLLNVSNQLCAFQRSVGTAQGTEKKNNVKNHYS